MWAVMNVSCDECELWWIWHYDECDTVTVWQCDECDECDECDSMKVMNVTAAFIVETSGRASAATKNRTVMITPQKLQLACYFRNKTLSRETRTSSYFNLYFLEFLLSKHYVHCTCGKHYVI